MSDALPGLDPQWQGATVAQAMLAAPRTMPGAATVAAVREAFERPKNQLVLLADDGVLLGVIGRDDLPAAAAGTSSALALASLDGCTVGPDEPVAEVHRQMVTAGERRRAVVDADRRLLGLLCLQRDRTGFCF